MNKFFWLLVILVVSNVHWVGAQSSSDILKAANNKVLFKNFKEALPGLNKLIAAEKNSETLSRAFFIRGKAHAGLKLLKDALSDFDHPLAFS